MIHFKGKLLFVYFKPLAFSRYTAEINIDTENFTNIVYLNFSSIFHGLSLCKRQSAGYSAGGLSLRSVLYSVCSTLRGSQVVQLLT